MTDKRKCTDCGAPLPADEVHPVCVACIFRRLSSLGTTIHPPETIPSAHASTSRPGHDAGKRDPDFYAEYELLGEIGRGGMGVIYKAHQSGLNRLVALKVIHAASQAGEAARRRFQAEVEVAARLSHPNIVPIFDTGQMDGCPCFSMEFFPAGTLAARMNDFLTKPAAGVRLLVKVAHAVSFAHRHGVLHRDLKPANVLLDDAGEPHVGDFGLAKLLDSDSDLTRSGAVLGSPNYMSPEQASGKSSSLTVATDVYSLGVMLYEMLTGRAPFTADTALETMRRVVEQEPQRPGAIVSGADPDLETICLKCLEKDPLRRYRTAEEFAEDLERWLRHEPIHARPITGLERSWKWVRRHPARAAILTVLGVALLGLVVVPTVLNRRLREANSVATAKAEETRKLLVRFHVAEGVDLMNQGDLAGSLPWFVKALQLDEGHPQQEEIHRVRIAATLHQMPRLLQMLKAGTNLTTGRFSPEGDRVLLHSADGAFAQVWEVASGRPITPPIRHEAFVRHASFDASGERIVTGSYDGTAQVWDARTGEPIAPPLRHVAGVSEAVFTPDGRRVVTAAFQQGMTIWDAASGELILESPIHEHVYDVACSPDGRWIAAAVDRGIRLWDNHTSRLSPLLESGMSFGLRRVQFGADSARVLGFSGSGARVWEVTSQAAVTPVLTHPGFWVFGARIGPGGQSVISFGRDGLARIWRTDNQPSTVPPLRHGHAVRFAEFSPDGSRIVTASRDHTARIWDAHSGEPLCMLRHGEWLNYATFSPDGRRVLTLDARTARIWDLASPSLAGPMLRVSRPHGLGFSADGTQILTADAEGMVQAWDIATSQEIPLSTVRRESALPTLAYTQSPERLPHPDGRRELVFEDGAVIRDMATQAKLTPLVRHREDLTTAAFSLDGRYLATASVDHTARVWDVQTGDPVTPLLRNPSTVHQAIFDPHDQHLAVLCQSGSIEVWRLEPDHRPLADLEALAQLLSGRYITPRRSFEELDQAALLALHRRLILNYPEDFQTTPEQQTYWHWREASLAPTTGSTLPIRQLMDTRADPSRWPWRARLEAGRMNWTNALESYSRALELDPKNPHLWRERGIVHQQRGELDQALADLSQAAQLAPDDANVWTERARLWLARNAPEPAVADLDRALALSPTSAEGHELRGLAATALRLWEKAIADFAESRRLRHRLSQGPGAPARGVIPARAPGTDPGCLDLGAYFNGTLSPGWIIPQDSRSAMGLPSLPRGTVEFAGTAFEIRGVVQLAGSESRLVRGTFPAAARGMVLPATCRRMHFLHGTDGELPKGTLAGKIVIHFEDGTTAEILLRYGEELAAVFSSNREAPRAPGSSIVWTAESTGHLRDQSLYRTTWINPRPGDRLVMLNYESAIARQGPCLLAITVETSSVP